MFVILDIDQTLADSSHRAHHLKKDPKDWDAFLSPDLVIKDGVVPGAERVVALFQEHKYDIVLLTGRNESTRDVTMRWLLEKFNLSVPDTHLLMRPNGNMLNAVEYKREQLLTFRQGLENKHNGFLLIEDDLAICAGLEGFGIVLKAPECWPLLFPVVAPVKEVVTE